MWEMAFLSLPYPDVLFNDDASHGIHVQVTQSASFRPAIAPRESLQRTLGIPDDQFSSDTADSLEGYVALMQRAWSHAYEERPHMSDVSNLLQQCMPSAPALFRPVGLASGRESAIRLVDSQNLPMEVRKECPPLPSASQGFFVDMHGEGSHTRTVADMLGCCHTGRSYKDSSNGTGPSVRMSELAVEPTAQTYGRFGNGETDA
jgi:hypothetical protein